MRERHEISKCMVRCSGVMGLSGTRDPRCIASGPGGKAVIGNSADGGSGVYPTRRSTKESEIIPCGAWPPGISQTSTDQTGNVAASGDDDALANGVAYEPGRLVDTELIHHTGTMALGRLCGNREQCGCLLRRLSFGDQPQ